MKEIPLTHGMVALVDDEDFADLNQFKWFAQKAPYTFYARRGFHRNGKMVIEHMHRRILNAKRGEKVDHENLNGLDCQRRNIRICTRSQNGQNRKKNIRGSSKFKGVGWHKRIEKWRARIQSEGKPIHLGYFIEGEHAARTYDAAARRLFGEFARTNFPD